MTKINMRIGAKLTALAMVASMFVSVLPAGAAEATSRKVTFTRLDASTATNATFSFNNTATLADTNTWTITWASGFNIASVVAGDITLTGGTTGAFGVAASCGGSDDYSFVVAGQVMTFTDCNANDEIAVEAVTLAFANSHITLPTAGSYTISLGGSITGDIQTVIVDDDYVTITANVDPTMSFDLDVSITDGESAAAYTIDFGQIAFSTPEASDGSAIPSIWVDLETNATGGAVVTVQSANDAMKSTSTADQFPAAGSVDGALAANTERYGICVNSEAALGGTVRTEAPAVTWTADSTYSESAGDCDGVAAGMLINGLSTAADLILAVTGPLDNGRAQVRVGMSVRSSTPAHPDYTDTLTFIATVTF